MIFTGDNNNLSVFDFVNQTMFICDAAAPVAGKTVFKRFRLANSVEGVAHYIVNQRMRRLQWPVRPYLSGSGLPIPWKGSRIISLINDVILLKIFLSSLAHCQYSAKAGFSKLINFHPPILPHAVLPVQCCQR